MTARKMHRFEGEMGGGCKHLFGADDVGFGGWCAQNYSATVHYNDDDHPFTVGDAPDVCDWKLQNIPGAAHTLAGKLWCGRGSADPVHNRGSEADLTGVVSLPAGEGGPVEETRATEITMVMETPVREPGKQEFKDPNAPGAVPDAPEGREWNLGPGAVLEEASTWSAKVAEGLQHAFRPLGHAPTLPEQAAGALRENDVVPLGPWTVRQWFCAPGGLPEWWEEPGELIAGLNVAGEPFTVDVWWAAVDKRMVRVVWGALMGLPEGELIAAVEKWPG